MKSRLVFLILALAFSFIAFHFTPAYSDFLPDRKYLIQASGYLTGKQAIYDSTLALQLGTSGEAGSNWLSTLDNGVVTIADDNYLNSGIWQTTMLQYGKYLVISGDAQDVSGNTIHLNLFGKLIGSNQDGSVYRITGKIVATETMKVIFSAKVTLIVSNMTSQILDSNGITVKSFEGLTDDHGYYFYNFRIPDNFVPGTYTVHVTAQIGSSLDSKTLALFVRPYYG